jgi:hypothetical protein
MRKGPPRKNSLGKTTTEGRSGSARSLTAVARMAASASAGLGQAFGVPSLRLSRPRGARRPGRGQSARCARLVAPEVLGRRLESAAIAVRRNAKAGPVAAFLPGGTRCGIFSRRGRGRYGWLFRLFVVGGLVVVHSRGARCAIRILTLYTSSTRTTGFELLGNRCAGSGGKSQESHCGG